jgi:tetratricopeptide (TPR) repeat protein
MWIRQKQWDRAIADFRQAIAAQPDLPEAYLNLSQAYGGLQNWTAAVAALDEAIELRPDAAQFYRERALLQQEQGDGAAAQQDFYEAIRRDRAKGASMEELANDFVLLGLLHQRAGDYAAALAAYDSAVQARADYAPAHRQRGNVLFELKRYDEAGRALDKYLRLKPLEPEVYQLRGQIYQALRQYPKAVEAYSWALLFKPEAQTFNYRGWANLELNADRAALADFEAALQLDETNRDALLGRGHALVRLGKVPAAVSSAQAALAQGPRDRPLLLAAARIYALAAEKPETPRESWSMKDSLPSHAEQAVALLRAALEQVRREDERRVFWRGSVQTEKSFRPIRRTNGYQELARRYGS